MAKKEKKELEATEQLSSTESKKTKKKKKKVKTREQKLVKKKRDITICLVVFTILFLFFGICGITTKVGSDALLEAVAQIEKVEYDIEPIKPVTNSEGKAIVDENGDFNFYIDEDVLATRNFRVLQITDVHIGAGAFSIRTDEFTVNTVEDLIRREKPDLVIVTGDIAYPVPFQSATLNNKKEARIFATMMERLGVYWTFAFGNHDTEAYSSYNREDIGEFYATTPEFKHCMYNNKKPVVDGKEVFGTGNFAINLRKNNADKTLIHTFFMVDSNSYLPDDPFGAAWKYDCIHSDQIKWYENTCKRLGLNKDNIDAKSTMYFHIPIIEFRDAYEDWNKNGRKDTSTVQHLQGVVGEDGKGALGTHERTDIYKSLIACGTTGLFCGHDHLNNSVFLMDKDGFDKGNPGIKLIYGMSIDYLAYPGIYKKVSQRGGRLIEINVPGQIKVSDEYKSSKDYDEKRFDEDNKTFGFITFRIPYWKDLNKGIDL